MHPRPGTTHATLSTVARLCRRGSVGFSGLFLGSLLLLPSLAEASSCVIRSPEGTDPPRVFEARRQMSALAPENRGGFEALAARIEQNRSAVEAGTLTAEDAEETGGLLISGQKLLPVLPVLYSDTAAEPINPSALEIQLFADFLNTSMYAYYQENSYEQFSVSGDVWGFERLPEDGGFYEEGDSGLSGGGAKVAAAAIPLYDSYVDFGQYDNDGPDGIPNSGDDDGLVDILSIVHPEVGAECGAPFDTNIWSHHSYLSSYGLGPFETNDNRSGGGKIKVDRFFIGPALNCDNSTQIDIGLFCHEFGHALGLKDLYDTDDEITGDSDGIGVWGLMGGGNWNSTTSPGHINAFYKHKLGWLNYFDVLNNSFICLPAVETSPMAVRLWTYGTYDTKEYFLVENRQPLGFDSALRAPGLVIYHVDEDRHDVWAAQNRVNADETQKAIDVETPDAVGPGHTTNRDDLDIAGDGNSGDTGDVWCAEGVDNSFNFFSNSDPRANSGTFSSITVENIGTCGGTGQRVCADFNVGVASPVDVCIQDCVNDACNELATCEAWWATPDIWVDHNADGIHDLPSPGIENKIWYRVQNLGPDLAAGTEVSLYLTPGAMGLEWPQDAAVHIGTRTIPVLESGEVTEDFFIFEYNELLDLVGHWCMGIVLTHPEDPNNSGSAPLTNNVAQINRQVLVDRAGTGARSTAAEGVADVVERTGGVETSSASGGNCSGEYVVKSKIYLRDGYNPEGGPRFGEIRIGTPPLFDDAIIPNGWTVDFDPGRGPFTLPFNGQDSVTVTISAANASHGEWAHVPLTLWNVNTNQAIGGITLDAAVDCVAPRAIGNLAADWRSIPGDDPDAPNVSLTWNRALVDADGQIELLDRYQVYRSINQGVEVLIDEVVVDDDPETAEFQWYDRVPDNDCPTTYQYRVRAIDAAGNIGDFSNAFLLECQVSDTPSLPTLAGQTSRAVPNPFRGETQIHYELSIGSDVEVSIFDATGQRIRTLGKAWNDAGSHQVIWDGFDEQGRGVASGIYFYQIESEGGVEKKKVVRTR